MAEMSWMGVSIQVGRGRGGRPAGTQWAGKTTTFYMIVGLIAPNGGQVVFDQRDVTHLPMHQRARRGLGYLSQEPSVFQKLTVEENVMAILEMLPLSVDERRERMESLLEQLSIKRLAKQMAYTLSGGERRRLGNYAGLGDESIGYLAGRAVQRSGPAGRV